MTSGKPSTTRKHPVGRAELVLTEDQTVEISLDRQGFHRLLLTLERLAKQGGLQTFERSSRRRRGANGPDRRATSLKRLVFAMNEVKNR